MKRCKVFLNDPFKKVVNVERDKVILAQEGGDGEPNVFVLNKSEAKVLRDVLIKVFEGEE